MKLQKIERNIQEWIGNHKFLWLLSLFILGTLLASLFIYTVGGTLQQAIIMSIIYSIIFITIDLLEWGNK